MRTFLIDKIELFSNHKSFGLGVDTQRNLWLLLHFKDLEIKSHTIFYQIDNGIPIESWFDDPADKELLKLELFLRTLHSVDDVRDVLRKTFQIHKLVLEA